MPPGDGTRHRAEIALDVAETIYAPDDRTSCFDVTARVEEDRITLVGLVDNDRTRAGVERIFDGVYSPERVRNELRSIEGVATARTAIASITPVRATGDNTAEQVTQVLYGADLTAYDRRGEWQRVRTPDGYLGWTRQYGLTRRVTDRDDPDAWRADAVLIDTQREPVPATDGAAALPERLPCGARCRVVSSGTEEAVVSFRTGAKARVPGEAVRSLHPYRNEDGTDPGREVVDVARRFLGTPYEWGGMGVEGIDCSGLVWIAYACIGLPLPRDSDQQERLGASVDRTELQPGDLLFFPGHVAISLGESAIIHAAESANEVTINSLDPDDDGYLADLDASLRSTKRLL